MALRRDFQLTVTEVYGWYEGFRAEQSNADDSTALCQVGGKLHALLAQIRHVQEEVRICYYIMYILYM